MTTVRLTRTLQLPDEVRAARCQRAPDLGPRLLFFSGGTALRDLSRTLKHYTHNSVHVITPFDSGGSSARLRDAFGMPSVGDLRNRLLALADDSLHGNHAVQHLLAYRLPEGEAARRELDDLLRDRHALVEPLPAPMRRIVRTHLRVFAERMPAGFDLGGASVGNLVLAGGTLHHDGDLDSVLYLFSKLVEARGLVLPVVEESLHLLAHLENGRVVFGQHAITGKEVPPLESPVTDLQLCRDLARAAREFAGAAVQPVEVAAPERLLRLLAGADLICFPMGSFYTSVVANLLPQGVGKAVRNAPSPKVYIPNTGHDPEQLGHTVASCVDRLLSTLRRDAGDDATAAELLDLVLVDSTNGDYPGGLESEALCSLGVTLVDLPLVTPESRPGLDPELLSRALLSLA